MRVHYVCIHRAEDNMGRRINVDDIVVFANKENVADFLDGRQGWELRIKASGEPWSGGETS